MGVCIKSEIRANDDADDDDNNNNMYSTAVRYDSIMLITFYIIMINIII